MLFFLLMAHIFLMTHASAAFGTIICLFFCWLWTFAVTHGLIMRTLCAAVRKKQLLLWTFNRGCLRTASSRWHQFMNSELLFPLRRKGVTFSVIGGGVWCLFWCSFIFITAVHRASPQYLANRFFFCHCCILMLQRVSKVYLKSFKMENFFKDFSGLFLSLFYWEIGKELILVWKRKHGRDVKHNMIRSNESTKDHNKTQTLWSCVWYLSLRANSSPLSI